MVPATGPNKVTSEQTHIVKTFSFSERIQYNGGAALVELFSFPASS